MQAYGMMCAISKKDAIVYRRQKKSPNKGAYLRIIKLSEG